MAVANRRAVNDDGSDALDTNIHNRLGNMPGMMAGVISAAARRVARPDQRTVSTVMAMSLGVAAVPVGWWAVIAGACLNRQHRQRKGRQ